MAVEIERKFLVRGDDWRRLVTDRTDIRQAYLSSGERSSTRVRIKDDETATLTV
jgi:CYTH domain-containing protein